MKKRTRKYTVEQYPVVLSYDPDDRVYIARSVDLRDCHSDGKTPEAAMRNIYEAMKGWMETAKKTVSQFRLLPDLSKKQKNFRSGASLKTRIAHLCQKGKYQHPY